MNIEEMSRHPHQVYIFMGTSGSGKTAILNELSKLGIREHVSHTTRKPRLHERNGVHYYFVTDGEFEKLDLLEFAEHSGHKYGVTETEFLKNLGEYPTSVICTELSGARQIQQAFPECTTLIYVRANRDEVVSRMRKRGDSLDAIAKRLAYDDEHDVWNNWVHADYIIENTGSITLEDAVAAALNIFELNYSTNTESVIKR